MPNWCSCDLYVNGDADKVAEFIEFAKSKTEEGMILDMDRFIPYPDNFKEMDRISEEWDKAHGGLTGKDNDWSKRPTDGFNAGGYDWCVDNWGTKWNFGEVELVNDDEYNGKRSLKYTFETAWSPPTPVILAMGEKFPELEFDLRYFESGSEFNGIYVVKNGEVSDDRTADYFGDRGG